MNKERLEDIIADFEMGLNAFVKQINGLYQDRYEFAYRPAFYANSDKANGDLPDLMVLEITDLVGGGELPSIKFDMNHITDEAALTGTAGICHCPFTLQLDGDNTPATQWPHMAASHHYTDDWGIIANAEVVTENGASTFFRHLGQVLIPAALANRKPNRTNPPSSKSVTAARYN